MGALDGIEFLTTTVDRGSFAAAAKVLGVTASAVSRRVARLEQELGVQLLARTTRSLRLTDDGRAFYERCVRILEELGEAKRDLARAKREPAGVLRVDAATALTRFLLVPALPLFLERYPELRVELTVRDTLIDPFVEGVDVLVRIGALPDSTLVARKLGESAIVIAASPAYLRRRGTPSSPRDLARHDAIGYLRDGRPAPWKFGGKLGDETFEVEGGFHTNDVDASLAAAVGGRGLIAAFDFILERELESGTLVRVLEEHRAPRWPIHVLYPQNRHLLPKVRVFVDFVAQVFASRASGAPPRAPSPAGRRTSRKKRTGSRPER